MSKKDIEILEVWYLCGFSMWIYMFIIEVVVDIYDLEDFFFNKIFGFFECLVNWLFSLMIYICSFGVFGGFVMCLYES